MIRLALLATALSLSVTSAPVMAQICTNAIGCVATPAAGAASAPATGMFGGYGAYGASTADATLANPYISESQFDSMGNLRSASSPTSDASPSPLTIVPAAPDSAQLGVPAKLADPPMASDPAAPRLTAIPQGPD